MSGIKLDTGKLEFDLLPWNEIEKIVSVLMWGRDKYGLNNWQTVKDGYKRFRRAALRHLISDTKGEKKDAETGHDHLIQVALACLMAVWHRDNKKMEVERKTKDQANDIEHCKICGDDIFIFGKSGEIKCAVCGHILYFGANYKPKKIAEVIKLDENKLAGRGKELEEYE